MREVPPSLPDFIDVSSRYSNNPRYEAIKGAWLGFAKDLQLRQFKAELNGEGRVHDGLLVAIIDPVGNTVRHADQMNLSPLSEEPSVTPLPCPDEEEDEYSARLKTYFSGIEQLGILREPYDGALIIARDGTLLAAGVYLHAQDCDREKLPIGYGTRHRAGLASSYLNEYQWVAVLSNETNDIRIYEEGAQEENYPPPKIEHHEKNLEDKIK